MDVTRCFFAPARPLPPSSASACGSSRAREREGASLSARELPLFATGTAVLLVVFAAAPFALGSSKMSFAAAIFEATSGLMTNGASALASPDTTGAGLLFWRALLQFLGGGFFIALMICLLPHGQGQADGFWMPDGPNWEASRLRRVAPRVLGVYAALTALCAVAYFAGGMSSFDAIAHAFSTLSTGGFSTHAASFDFFKKPDLQWIAIIFMLLAALPLGTVAMLFKGELQPLLSHREVQLFVERRGRHRRARLDAICRWPASRAVGSACAMPPSTW